MSLKIEGWMPSVRSSSMSSFGFVASARAMPDRRFGHGRNACFRPNSGA
jgi:hypothetical protein